MPPRMLSGPPAQRALLRGMAQMAGLLRPTLGPIPRAVAIARLSGTDGPEILDNGATIARRTLELADPFEDMGAMLIRHVAWRVYERTGDGSATAAVLAHALVRATTRCIAAGASPVPIRRGLERGLAVATAALRAQARPIDGPADIARLIAGSLGDADLADRLGEAVDAAGPDGAVLVEDTQATRTSVEYIDGVRWNAGFVSSFLLAPGEATTSRLMNPRVLVTDYILERADDLVPTLEACVAAGERSLFVVAPDVRDAAVGLLAANRQRGVIDAVAAVKAPSYGAVRDGILGDIAAITGGRCLWQARGDRLADVQISDLGRARQAWASHVAFGILGGHGSKDTIRQRVADAKAELKAERDDYTRRMLQARIGQLLGTVATVHVGAATPAEQAELKLRVEAVVRASRSALQEGVVPGAGAAYLACTPALAPALADVPPDEAVGVQALLDALAEPMRTILCNAGLDAAPLLHRARCDTRHVYDALAQQWVDPWQAGLLDPLAVTLAALETSVSMALTALASEVLVRRQHPVRAVEP